MVSEMLLSLHQVLNSSEVKLVPASDLRYKKIFMSFFNIAPLQLSKALMVDAEDLSSKLILSRYLDTGSPKKRKFLALQLGIPLKMPGEGTQSMKMCSKGMPLNLIGFLESGVLEEMAILHISHQASPLKLSSKSSQIFDFDAAIRDEMAL